MEWFAFALLGMIFYSVAGLLDKFLLSSYTDDSNAYIVCQVLASQLFTIPVFLISGADFVYPQTLFALLFGSLQVFPCFFYMKALAIEEISKVSALEYVYPLFVFIGSALILGEVLEMRHYAGGLLLLVGTLLISRNKKSSDLTDLYSYGSTNNSLISKQLGQFISSLSPAIKPFLSYWVLTAAYYLSLKYLLISIDEWNLYIWSSLGSLIAVLPLMAFSSIRGEVKSFFGQGGLAVGALISEETFQFLGIIFSIFAYAIGSVTLVSSIGALQPIMTVLIILGLGVLTPKLANVINEKTDWCSLKQKGFSFLVVAIGIYFVS
ncbi:MAG: EamA family transporter [Methanothrix sp.]|nr:EamA family transporter [Methanothrix sp.]MDD4446487.1 EamA family transporter [Methanothrix sp.]